MENNKAITRISELYVGARVQSLATGSYGTVTGFRYFEKHYTRLPEYPDPGEFHYRWVHKGSGIETDSEDSFDVLWDNGKESAGCFAHGNIRLLGNEQLREDHKTLLIQNEQLKKQLIYYQRLADSYTKINRRDWEMQQDYLPYEESPYGDS